MHIDTREISWRTIRAWAEEELDKLRDGLESPNAEWEDVLQIRAEINRLRELLGLPKEIDDGNRQIDPERFNRY